MDGMLSQDEINALLTGMDLSSDTSAQESEESASAVQIDESLLTPDERDAIGEIANISMGSSATTLYSLVNRKVNITTPIVQIANWEMVVDAYERPCVFIQINYTAGLDGSNTMILKEHDVKVITDLMMGGDGSNTDGELGELHLSAISEAMNQMMGSAATSMSTMLGKMIDISPPDASLVDLNDFKKGGEIAPFLEGNFVKISFRLQIDDLVDSTIMQLYPIEFAKGLFESFVLNQPEPEPAPAPAPAPSAPPVMEMPAGQPDMSQMNMGMPMQNMPMQGMPMQSMPQMGMPMQSMPMQGMPMMGMPMQSMPQMNIQPAQFQSFSNNMGTAAGQENIGLIRDVPLEVTVELGRTKKSIAEILDFAPGTIIELDKIAGEPIDVLVNGKFVAKGEVVVIEESFGIRVTEIIK
ncbi:MAG: flagellar motor switch phosphatase FliY [Lachnospiraceae bacterium]|nr:flagellar motor switch phosphatase FliY [Lachnospiraceae bacterium]MDE6184754.1 flagellar motor switch phosphatase FliY [Lachnospiraceae bacterium]MDE7287665.1 flagellar motor switch phosphatase FliY [Lachnospiraceae bacterium]